MMSRFSLSYPKRSNVNILLLSFPPLLFFPWTVLECRNNLNLRLEHADTRYESPESGLDGFQMGRKIVIPDKMLAQKVLNASAYEWSGVPQRPGRQERSPVCLWRPIRWELAVFSTQQQVAVITLSKLDESSVNLLFSRLLFHTGVSACWSHLTSS